MDIGKDKDEGKKYRKKKKNCKSKAKIAHQI